MQKSKRWENANGWYGVVTLIRRKLPCCVETKIATIKEVKRKVKHFIKCYGYDLDETLFDEIFEDEAKTKEVKKCMKTNE